MDPIRVAGVGDVTLEELRAMMIAYVNAGAPKPVLEGSRQEKQTILREIAATGDSQMKSLVDSLLKE